MQHQKRPQTQPSTDKGELSCTQNKFTFIICSHPHNNSGSGGGASPHFPGEKNEANMVEYLAQNHTAWTWQHPDLNRDLSIPNPVFFSLHLQLHCTVKSFKGWGSRKPLRWRKGAEPAGPGREQGRQGLFHRKLSQLMFTLTWNPLKSPCNRSATHKCFEKVVQTQMPT